jgi:hypothetical protein
MEGKTGSMTLEEEIAELKETIRGYETLLMKAIAEGNETDKVLYAGLIKTRGDNLHDLNQQLLLQARKYILL